MNFEEDYSAEVERAARRLRAARRIASIVVIGGGLGLRGFGYDLHLPFVVVKFGGSVLWGAMVFFLLGSALGKIDDRKIAFGAFVFAIVIEAFRLFHTPWLDAFRLTIPGALLIGRVFSLWNILAYGVGIALAASIDRRCLRN